MKLRHFALLFLYGILLVVPSAAQYANKLLLDWQQVCDLVPEGLDVPSAVATDKDGYIYVAGFRNSGSYWSKATFMKLDRVSGAILWRWESSRVTTNGDLPYFTGRFARIQVRSNEDPVVLFSKDDGLMKFSKTDGTVRWTVPGSSNSSGQYDITFDPVGDIVMVGATFAAAKYRSSDGARLWSYSPQGFAGFLLRAVKTDSFGNCVATGYARSTETGYRAFTVKLSGNTGLPMWTVTEQESASTSSMGGRLLDLDSVGNPAVATYSGRLIRYRAINGEKFWESSFTGNPTAMVSDSRGDLYLASVRTSVDATSPTGTSQTATVQKFFSQGSRLWTVSAGNTVYSLLQRESEVYAMGVSGTQLVLMAWKTDSGVPALQLPYTERSTDSRMFPSQAVTLMAFQLSSPVIILAFPRLEGSPSNYTFPASITTLRYSLSPTLSNLRKEWVLQKRARLNVSTAGDPFTTSAYIEWGTTTAYGETTASQKILSASLPMGTQTFDLTALKDDTLFHARAVAVSPRGFTYSQDFTFKTGWDASGNGLPDQWELDHWGNTYTRSALADDDRDGLNSLVEYAFGKKPRIPDSPGAVPITMDADGRLMVSLSKRPYITLKPEVSGDLKTWLPAELVTDTDDLLIARDPEPSGLQLRARFMRVRVVSQ